MTITKQNGKYSSFNKIKFEENLCCVFLFTFLTWDIILTDPIVFYYRPKYSHTEVTILNLMFNYFYKKNHSPPLFWNIYRFSIYWLVGFYGISTFVGYLIPNPFLYK